MDTTCPHCQSKNTQAARVAVAAGTSAFRGSTAAVGVFGAPGAQFGVIAGSSQSSLAGELDPGGKPGYALLVTLVVTTFLGGSLAVSECGLRAHQAFFWAWLLLSVYALLRRRARRANWALAIRRYAREWVCLACGFRFEP
jgi:hypothetical protein